MSEVLVPHREMEVDPGEPLESTGQPVWHMTWNNRSPTVSKVEGVTPEAVPDLHTNAMASLTPPTDKTNKIPSKMHVSGLCPGHRGK